MAKTLLRRAAFDRNRDFVAARDLTFSGKALGSGQPFDKRIVTVRKLRQLYEARFLDMRDTTDPVDQALAEADAQQPRRMAEALTDAELRGLLEEAGQIVRYTTPRPRLIEYAREAGLL